VVVMRVRLTREAADLAFVAEGIALGAPEVGKPYRIMRSDGTTTASCTTDVAEVVSAGPNGVVFRTITGNTWRVERLDLEQLAIAERMEQA
jgi:hypothetical protein